MSSRRRTAFNRHFDEKMKSSEFAKAYTEARQEIDAVDRLVRALDAARLAEGMSKADLARAIRAKPEIVRRLFTQREPNPTLSTVVSLAEALGCRLELVAGTRRSTGMPATRCR
ncbi:MAG: helix-turn-helix transcriptional regulator [Polyangiaceae bacterium]|nr:helix-turn-helix transcriptional regulator [Polyangiaceae bacterium]